MNNYCSNCGEPLAGAKFCPNCGVPVSSETSENIESLKDSSEPSKFILPETPKPRKKKGCLTYLVAVILFLTFITLWAVLSENSPHQSKLEKVTGVNADQAEQIESILKKCDIERIDSIEADESLNDMNAKDEKGYRISADGIDNIILYLKSSNKVNMIRYADNNLYAKGKVISTMSDYTFTVDEESTLQIKCQNAVKEVLKSPSTAKFPNITKWGFSKDKGEITIQSYVDSQNSFGATIRSDFQFILSKNGTIKSFIFDGEELITK